MKIKDHLKTIITLLVIIILITTSYTYLGAKNSQEKIKIFAGSASKPALEETAKKFEQKHDIKVELHFSGSGTMLSKMKMSKKGDLYIPGSPDYMKQAIQENIVYPQTTTKTSYLVPAIITPQDNPKNINSLKDLKGKTVGIGAPESVCVGEYAIDTLEYNNLERIKKDIKTHAESCSKTASLSVIGKVDAVIGWKVFNSWHPNETDLIKIEPSKIPKIAFIPAAISKYTKNRKNSEMFLSYLNSPEGRKSFAKYGYIPTEKKAREYAPNAKIIDLDGG